MARYTEKIGKGEIVSRNEIKVMLEEERESDREEWIAKREDGISLIEPDDGKTIVVYSKEWYKFYVIVYENGGIEIVDGEDGEPPIVMPELVKGDIAFDATPSEWTNKNVVVEISTNFEGYILEYSKTAEEQDWLSYTSGVEYEENGTIYARLRKENKVSNVSTENVNNIDKVDPSIGTIIPTTNGATFNGTDDLSKIIAYGYSESSNDEPTNWTSVPETLELTDVSLTSLTANKTYHVWLKDQAGNTANKEFITGAMPTLDTNMETGNIKFTYTPSNWTNGNVTVGINTEIEQYTLQYSKTGEPSDWRNYTSEVEYEQNGPVYARLTEGTNISNTATGNVTNIDKKIPIITEVTTSSSGATFKATDEGSGIIEYGYSTNVNEQPTSWKRIEATKNLLDGRITGLYSNINYYIWVRDQAGNMGKAEVVTGRVPGAEAIQFGEVTWNSSSGTAQVPVYVSEPGYEIKYRASGKSLGPEQSIENGGIIYNIYSGTLIEAYLVDDMGQMGDWKRLLVEDSTPPTLTSFTLSKTTVTAKQSFTATITHQDSQGGVAPIRYWVLTGSATAVGKNYTSYTGGSFSGNTVTVTALATLGKQYLHILTFDRGQNTQEAISSAITVEDKIAPLGATITFAKTTVALNEVTTAQITHTDEQSGVDLSSCRWKLTNSSTPVGTSLSNYSAISFSKNPSNIPIIGQSVAGKYYLHVLTIDKAGNAKETVSSAINVGI